jgi:alpha-ketoglutaric semialdehyde dehydrogenase
MSNQKGRMRDRLRRAAPPPMTRVVSTSPQDPRDVVIEVPAAGDQAVAAAVTRSHAAQQEWRRTPATARSQALDELASLLLDCEEELASLVVREVGKPVIEARGEIRRAVSILRYNAQLALDPTGDHHGERDGFSYTHRKPHGVVGLITPWNFPVAIPVWKAAPALATGNAAVIKPAPEATACALRLHELASRCLPADLLAALPGAAQTGAAVVDHVDAVSFTGSTAVGRTVASQAVARGLPVQAEMGGLNASIVLPDADLDTAAASIASAATDYAGQKCTATSRVIVVGDRFADVVDALADAWAALVVGDPRDPATTVGPVISAGARDRVADAAASSGGRVLQPASMAGDGWMAAPTLVVEPSPQSALLHDEVFGPIVTVVSVRSPAEALSRANQSRLGLVTSIYGNALDVVLSLAEQVESGVVKVNRPTTGVDFWLPFGGSGDSSYGGRELGRAARDFYTTTQTVSVSARA